MANQESSETFRAILKSQYHAALAMLKEALEHCPDDVWYSQAQVDSFWQIAYHTLFFTHLYLQPNQATFHPWEGHKEACQYPDGIAGPADPGSTLPLLPKPYTKAEVLAYWDVCDQMVDEAVDALDLQSPESGFYWYEVSKLEHQLINLRHIQHHAAQLADRLRAAAGLGIGWVGARQP